MSVAHPGVFVVSLLQAPMKRYGCADKVVINYFLMLLIEWLWPVTRSLDGVFLIIVPGL
jgi:hypothetical protein